MGAKANRGAWLRRHVRGPVAVVMVALGLLLITGIGLALLHRDDNSTANRTLTETAPLLAQARSRAAAGDVDGAVALLDDAARRASDADVRRTLRDAAAGVLVDATGRASAVHDAPAAVHDAQRAAGYADTPTGRAANEHLPGVLLSAAEDLLRTHDTTPTAAGWLRRIQGGWPQSDEARTATGLLAESVPVRALVTSHGAGVGGVDVALARTGGGVALARGRSDAAGVADLGLVVPGMYMLTVTAAPGPPGPPPVVVTVAPAQDNVLDVSPG